MMSNNDTMYCHQCGKQIPTGAAFCSGCGTAVTAPTPAENPIRQVKHDGSKGPSRRRLGLWVGAAGALLLAAAGAAVLIGVSDPRLPAQAGVDIGLGDSVTLLNKRLADKQLFSFEMVISPSGRTYKTRRTRVPQIGDDGPYLALLEHVPSADNEPVLLGESDDILLQTFERMDVTTKKGRVSRIDFRRCCRTSASDPCTCSSEDWEETRKWLPAFGWETSETLGEQHVREVSWLRFGWTLEARYTQQGERGTIAVQLELD